MAQYDFQIADYERIFRKRYKIVLAAVGLAVVASLIFAKSKPPIYSSTAEVKVDRNSVMGLGMEALMYGTWDNIETQTRVITSYPVLLRAGKSLSLVSDTIPDDDHPSDDGIMEKLEGIRSSISTSISTGTNIINITATSRSAKEARDIANAVAFAYKDYSIYGKKRHALKTKAFVEEQLSRCQKDLASAEAKVEQFAERKGVPSISQNAVRLVAEASRLEAEIRQVENDITIVTYQSSRLARSMDAMKNDSMSTSNKAIGDSALPASSMGWVTQVTDKDQGIAQINNRLIGLQLELEDQRVFYKKGHPATKATEKKIKQAMTEILFEYRRKLSDLEASRAEMLVKKQSVEAQLAQLPSSELEYSRLMREVNVREELNTMFTKRLQEALIAEAGIVDDVTIVAMAQLPRAAINKDLNRILGMGIFLGLIFGIVGAIIREMFDTSIGTIEEVERSLKMVVLAVVPHIHSEDLKAAKVARRNKGRDDPGQAYYRSVLVTHFNPKDPTAETYRILRTNLDYLAATSPLKTILMTSATMQEGKSTTIGNLAVACAQAGKKVLILECNLRRPSLHRLFGIDRGPGTSDILIDKARWQDCVKSVAEIALGKFSMDEIMAMPGLDNFHIIDHGHRPPNPAELLASPKMDQLLSELRDNFDLILVDAPPLLPVADSLVLSKKVDGVILVYMVGKAPRNSLRLAKERLETMGARILGLVLNDIRPESTGLTYSSYSMYAYGRDSDKLGKHGHRHHKTAVHK